METRFLETFVAVVERGSLVGAARELAVTPAAVAQRLRALESEFGVQLVMRTGRTVRPTSAGRVIFDRCHAILAALRALPWATSDRTLAGVIRLGAVSTALTGLLPDMLAGLSRSQPDIDVHVAPGTSRDLYQRVLDGDLDVALMVEPPFAIPKTLAWGRVREEPLLLIAPSQLAGSEPDTLLREHPFIRYDRSHWGGRLAETYLQGRGLVPRERFELDGLESIAVMVDRGLGVSLVPDWAPPWPAGLALARWIISDPALRRNIGFLWFQGSPRLRLVDALLGETGLQREHGSGLHDAPLTGMAFADRLAPVLQTHDARI